MLEAGQLPVSDDPAIELKTVAHCLQRQATALADLSRAVDKARSKDTLQNASRAVELEAQELDALAAHLRRIRSELNSIQ